MVLLYHYFARWTVPIGPRNLYPYGNIFAGETRYGFLGVELFFVISGFVITLTLRRCASIQEFALRRFARLWPTMAICASITYVLCHLIPNSPFEPSLGDFLPSLTFTDPQAFDFLTHSSRFDWMDGSYWSLFAEVRFYAIAGVVYFAQRQRYERNMLTLSAVVLGAHFLAYLSGHTSFAQALETIGIAQTLPWFLIGIGFYAGRLAPFLWVALPGLVSLYIEGEVATSVCAGALLIIPLVWAAYRTRAGSRLLAAKPLVTIGTASYSLYLLHQYLGIALIHEIGIETGMHGYSSALIAVAVAAVLTVVSILLYRYVEAPLNRLIVSVTIRGTLPVSTVAPI